MKLQIAVNERGMPIGEDHPRAVLTNSDVDRIFDLVEEGYTSREIAGMLDCSVDTVKKIRCGHRRCQAPAGHKMVHI